MHQDNLIELILADNVAFLLSVQNLWIFFRNKIDPNKNSIKFTLEQIWRKMTVKLANNSTYVTAISGIIWNSIVTSYIFGAIYRFVRVFFLSIRFHRLLCVSLGVFNHSLGYQRTLYEWFFCDLFHSFVLFLFCFVLDWDLSFHCKKKCFTICLRDYSGISDCTQVFDTADAVLSDYPSIHGAILVFTFHVPVKCFGFLRRFCRVTVRKWRIFPPILLETIETTELYFDWPKIGIRRTPRSCEFRESVRKRGRCSTGDSPRNGKIILEIGQTNLFYSF